MRGGNKTWRERLSVVPRSSFVRAVVEVCKGEARKGEAQQKEGAQLELGAAVGAGTTRTRSERSAPSSRIYS
jgi:hypothetical protein